MTLEIIGTVRGAGTGRGGPWKANLIVSEHRGMFKTSGNVEVLFDDKATKDLLNHLKIDSAIYLGEKTLGKSIYIIIR